MAAASDAHAAEAGSIKLLIVAPREFHAALAEFAAFKRTRMDVRIGELEDILAKTKGVDDPERLKRFLFDAWKRDSVRHVLLVGDADVMPVRYMVLDRITPAAFDYAFYPSDLYYADVADAGGEFDDWNARKEGFHAAYFGEVRGEKNKDDPINYDAIHYRPELALGRWPVSTEAEVRVVAAKTIRYEKSLVQPKADARRAAFAVAGGWVDVRDRMDRMASHLPKGWTVEKRYYADKDRPASTPPPDESNVVALLNGGVRLMAHAGHGKDDQWEQSITVGSLKNLDNADCLPVLISADCSTARLATLPPYEAYIAVAGGRHAGSDHGEVFTAPPPPPAPYQKGACNGTGLGEQMLRAGPGGAAAYIGCNTGSQPCGVTLLEGFIRAIGAGGDAPLLGECWRDAVAYYYEHEHLATLKPTPDWYPASIFFQGMKFMLYGDPTLPIGGVP